MSRSDPIRTSNYSAIELNNRAASCLFVVGVGLSFAALDSGEWKTAGVRSAVDIAFAITAIAFLISGLIDRLYLMPRAEDRRQRDFLGNAFGLSLSDSPTDGYYNNDARDPNRRIAAQVLENSLFTKNISLMMVRRLRWKIALYFIAWLAFAFWRDTSLGVLVVASQALFSEEIIAKWLRLEWLRTRAERTYDDLYKLFEISPPAKRFSALTADALLFYERSKAVASITLSSKIFDEVNPKLSSEWDQIRKRLRID